MSFMLEVLVADASLPVACSSWSVGPTGLPENGVLETSVDLGTQSRTPVRIIG
jgi:hypothetical protein